MEDLPVQQVETPTFLGATLDSHPMWKDHIEGLEERAIKKLSLMKKLKGTSWRVGRGGGQIPKYYAKYTLVPYAP